LGVVVGSWDGVSVPTNATLLGLIGLQYDQLDSHVRSAFARLKQCGVKCVLRCNDYGDINEVSEYAKRMGVVGEDEEIKIFKANVNPNGDC
jgi:hypothetical protein